MFWKKRKTQKFPLVFFCFIALGIIISGIILMTILFKHKSDLANKENILVNNIDQTIDQSIDLETKYFSEIEKLLFYNNQDQSIDNIFKNTKNILLSVRVPQEMRDVHLKTFLGVLRLEESQNILDLEEVQKKVNNLLADILVLKTK